MAEKSGLDKGIAHIKEEYIIRNDAEDKHEIVAKKPKLDDVEKKKKRGQFKNRHGKNKMQTDVSSYLCSSLVDVPEDALTLPQCQNANCKYLHDLEQYLNSKLPDIGNQCYSFETKGHCPRGVTCRFGQSHITETGRNKKDNEKIAQFENTALKCINYLTKELQIRLRKRTYDFSNSLKIVENLSKQSVVIEPSDEHVTGNSVVTGNGTSNVSDLGPCPDEDLIRLRPVEKRRIDWKRRLYLSPLTTLGNLPFRRICKEFGADVTCAEMTMAPSLLQGYQYEWALVKRHQSEDLFGVQVCGNNPAVLTKCAQLLEESTSVDFIDVNLGCPIDLVYEKGGGSGLLRREKVLESVVKCMSGLLNLPLTIKTRTGVYADKNVAHKLIPMFAANGISLITVHGRSREQRYTRTADWNYIEECAKIAKPTPVFGNGDILSYADYSERMEHFPDISGVMIGRGALYKPWIFTEIKQQRDWDISSAERFEVIRKYVNYGLDHWGSDTKGVELTRQFTLEWLSFLYRYIPVGLLEQPPQKINERPPRYVGRDHLETLMASSNCADWVKITEMLLGPVPDNFHFIPKHKANAWAS